MKKVTKEDYSEKAFDKLYESYIKRSEKLGKKYGIRKPLERPKFESMYVAEKNDAIDRVNAGEIKSTGSIVNKIAKRDVILSYTRARALRSGLADVDTSSISDPELLNSITTISGLTIMEMRSPENVADVKKTVSQYNEYLKSQGYDDSYDRRKKIGQVFFGSP